MKIREILDAKGRDVVTVRPEDTVADAPRRLHRLRRHPIGREWRRGMRGTAGHAGHEHAALPSSGEWRVWGRPRRPG